MDQVHCDLSYYETPVEESKVFESFCFMDEAGTPLFDQFSSYPDQLEFGTRLGIFTLMQAAEENLLIQLPQGPISIRFEARATSFKCVKQGGILQLERFRTAFP